MRRIIMAATNFSSFQEDVPIIDVHFHYFAPHILGPLKEFVIASPEETEDAMAKLVTIPIFRPDINIIDLSPGDDGCHLFSCNLVEIQH